MHWSLRSERKKGNNRKIDNTRNQDISYKEEEKGMPNVIKRPKMIVSTGFENWWF